MACTVAELAGEHRTDEAVAMPIATGGLAVAGRRAPAGSLKDA
jgi:hypothetical protein